MGEQNGKDAADRIESFEKLRSMDYYYIDKTMLIKELLENFSNVTLFTRPNRFGKSLNISMLQSFFEIGTDPKLFDGLEISKEQNLCDEYPGKYPVISINLKDVAGTDFEEAQSSLATVIRSEAMRHQYLLESSRLSEFDKNEFRSLLENEMPANVIMQSVLTLSHILQIHYSTK